jgi:hypothetical protein
MRSGDEAMRNLKVRVDPFRHSSKGVTWAVSKETRLNLEREIPGPLLYHKPGVTRRDGMEERSGGIGVEEDTVDGTGTSGVGDRWG